MKNLKTIVKEIESGYYEEDGGFMTQWLIDDLSELLEYKSKEKAKQKILNLFDARIKKQINLPKEIKEVIEENFWKLL